MIDQTKVEALCKRFREEAKALGVKTFILGVDISDEDMQLYAIGHRAWIMALHANIGDELIGKLYPDQRPRSLVTDA